VENLCGESRFRHSNSNFWYPMESRRFKVQFRRLCLLRYISWPTRPVFFMVRSVLIRGSIEREPFTALEQWKISRSLWVAVGNCTVSKWIVPMSTMVVRCKSFLFVSRKQKSKILCCDLCLSCDQSDSTWNMSIIMRPSDS